MKIDKINDYTFQFFYEFSTGWSNNIGKCCVRVINKSDCPIVIELGQCIKNPVPSIINDVDMVSGKILSNVKKGLSSLGKQLILDTEELFGISEKATENNIVNGIIVCLHKLWKIKNNRKDFNNAIWVLYYPSDIIKDGIERYFYINALDEKKTDNLIPTSINEIKRLTGLDKDDLIICKEYLE